MKRISINSSMISLFFVVCGLILILSHLKNYDISGKEMGVEKVEEVIRQYATTCYALEGSYPSNIKYLQKNYGLILNEDLYIYYYDAFASNILPDIKVVKKGEREGNHE